MKASNLTRHTFVLGGRTLEYSSLRNYVCDKCGGGVTRKIVRDPETDTTIDLVSCARCGCEEIISESKYMQQISDAAEVLSKPHLRELYGIPKVTMDARQAIDELFEEEQ